MDNIMQTFTKGEVIIPEGAPGDRTYRIVSGEVVICKAGPDGKMFPIARLGPHEVFGEMYLFEGGGRRSATAVASTDVKVEVYFQDMIEAELEQAPPEVRQMLMGFSRRLKNTTNQMADLSRSQRLVELPDGSVRFTDTR